MKHLVIEWSLFDYLCLIYIVKTWAIDFTAVISAFIYSSDPEEAQLLLLQMNRDYKHLQEPVGHIQQSGLNFSNVVVSDHVHDNLFKKGILNKAIKQILP